MSPKVKGQFWKMWPITGTVCPRFLLFACKDHFDYYSYDQNIDLQVNQRGIKCIDTCIEVITQFVSRSFFTSGSHFLRSPRQCSFCHQSLVFSTGCVLCIVVCMFFFAMALSRFIFDSWVSVSFTSNSEI